MDTVSHNVIMQLLSPIGAKELELLVLLYKGNKWFTYTKTSPGNNSSVCDTQARHLLSAFEDIFLLHEILSRYLLVR